LRKFSESRKSLCRKDLGKRGRPRRRKLLLDKDLRQVGIAGVEPSHADLIRISESPDPYP